MDTLREHHILVPAEQVSHRLGGNISIRCCRVVLVANQEKAGEETIRDTARAFEDSDHDRDMLLIRGTDKELFLSSQE